MATATYKRVLVEVDSVKFYPIEAKYAVSRAANQAGRRIGESMQARAYIWVDPHDTARRRRRRTRSTRSPSPTTPRMGRRC
jgi:hypothetical protein